MRNNLLNRRFKYSYSDACLWLVIINSFIFLLTDFVRPVLGNFELIYWLSMVPAFVKYYHAYWQFFTYMFVHGSISHLFFNMFGLLMFGRQIERQLGTREFLCFYFVTGFLSGVASYLIYVFSGISPALMGASGALYGLLFLFAVMYPRVRILLFFIIPMSAPAAIAVFALICIFEEVFTTSGTANLTHLAGFAFAWIYCRVRYRVRPIEVWKNNSN